MDCPDCETELEPDSVWPSVAWCPTCRIWWECEADYIDFENIAQWVVGKSDPQPPPPPGSSPEPPPEPRK